MATISRVLVNGAGPAGLSSAIALARQGVEVEVAEVRPDRSVLGSELLLSSPNLRSLDELGVAEALVSEGAPVASYALRAADNTLLAEIAAPKVARDELPAGLGITRRALHDGLYDGALAAGASIHHGTELEALEQQDGFVEATFASGPSGRYDLVVGADGVRSQIRDLVFSDTAAPQYAGQCVWRARVPQRGEGCLETWEGEETIAGIVTVSSDTAYLFCLVNRETVPRLDPDRFADLLRDDLKEFDNGLIAWTKEQLSSESYIHFSPMMCTIMPSPWYRGNVLLIGDAAHATTPHIAYGAGLAIEDGVVLGDQIEKSDSLEAALAGFMSRRFERCRMVVEGGLQISRWQQSRRDQSEDAAALTSDIWKTLAEPV